MTYSTLASRCRWALVFAMAVAFLITAPALTRASDVTIDTAISYQTIEGFGTCLAWWVNDPNGSVYYDPTFRNLYAKDLGFNILRVEMHPSALMGPGGTLDSPVDLVDDVATNASKYDMARREVAVYGDLASWLRDNVLEPGTERVVGAFWTPAHWLKGPTGTTYNGGANPAPWAQGTSNTAGGRLKQDSTNKTLFARYAAAWIRAFEQRYGVKFVGVSLQNELLWETAYNSASYWKNETGTVDQFWQYADALRAVGDYFAAKGMTVKIMGPHHANIAGSPGNPWHLGIQMGFINAVRNHASGNLMDSLGIIASNDYVDEGMVNHAVMLHGYWNGKAATPVTWGSSADGNVAQYGKQNWFQETSGEGATWDKDNALGLALRYHDALVQGHASAYIYWQTADGAADVNGNILLGTNQLANPTSSKKYCSVKHFSRYIRPGAHRVKATFDQSGWASYGGAHEDDTYNSINVSAFVKDNNLTVVLVNMRATADTTNVKIPSSLGIASIQQFRTTGSESFATQPNLTVANGQVSVSVPALSVVTLYAQGTGGGGTTNPTLSVTKAGTGGGTVTSAPAGISCGATCSMSCGSGSTYTLTAAPAAGSTFAGWGGACSGNGSCSVTMSAAQSVTATFAASGSGGNTTYGNNGQPWAVGSGTTRIQAENYDTGGEGVAFHDTSAANEGGQYRTDGVDIEAASGGGYDVGWIGAGEWLQYSVNVAAAGSYDVKLHVARQPAGSQTVKVLFGGLDKTGALVVPSTGGWQTWTDVTKTGLSLGAGAQSLRIAMSGGDFNVDWIEITPSAATPPPAGGGTTYGNGGKPWAIGSGTARIEAENYDTGGEGVAYHDADTTNSGGQYRNDAVDIETASGGGSDVGWIVAGEWLDYTVDVATAGNYDLKLHVARQPAGSQTVKVLFGGVDKTGDLAVPSTGGWQTWTDVVKTGVGLSAGLQTMRLALTGTDFNVDWIEITPSVAPTTYALTVGKAGTGTGTVTSSPAGISCGAACSSSFSAGTTVTLTATAAAGSSFTGWGGACSGAGTCSVTMSAAKSVTATFNTTSASQTTYGNNGNPWTIGSGTTRIQIENYDQGGEGVAYHDTTSGNANGQYRTDDVDIETTTGGGWNVGWIVAGEWLEYTVNVATAGNYDLTLRVARQTAGNSTVQLFAADVDKTGAWSVPSTGAWQTWTTITKTVSLSAGTQVLRLAMVGSEFNLDWLELKPSSATPPPPTVPALTIFDDALAAGWSDSSWSATVDMGGSAPVHAGTKAINVTLSTWGALALTRSTTQATTGYTALRFWVHGGTGAAKSLRVFTYTGDTTGQSTAATVSAAANAWTQITVPLSALGSPSLIKRVAIQENNGANEPLIAVDDLALVP